MSDRRHEKGREGGKAGERMDMRREIRWCYIEDHDQEMR